MTRNKIERAALLFNDRGRGRGRDGGRGRGRCRGRGRGIGRGRGRGRGDMYFQKDTGNFEKELQQVINDAGKSKHPKRILGLFHPKMTPMLSFSGMYLKPFIYHRNITNSQ